MVTSNVFRLKRVVAILAVVVLSFSSFSVMKSNVFAETQSQKEAVKATNDYLTTMAFSKKGLTDMLEYEGYSPLDIDYAINNVKVNWNLQAKKSAKAYLKVMPFSKKSLIAQLRYDGFSKKQAKYGVKYCKAKWKTQAKRMGRLVLRTRKMSYGKLVKKLKKEGFTKAEAKYGAKKALKTVTYKAPDKPRLKTISLSQKELSDLVHSR